MKTILVTNNPRMRDTYKEIHTVAFHDCSYEALLINVRDRIHAGARLLTHPLYGSVKPKETPYRSVLLDVPGERGAEQGPDVAAAVRTDPESVRLIEEALAACRKFPDKASAYDDAVLKDCMTVDLSLFQTIAGQGGA